MADFLISPERQRVVVPTSRVPVEVMDHVTQVRYKGRDLSVLPLTVDTAWMLRNLGIEIGSPINYTYDWPGRFKPFDHQRATAAFLTLNKYSFVFNDIGTGKSISTLWAADYLMKQGAIKRVLILAPLSTLERVWGDEIFMNLYQRECRVLHGTKARRLKLLAQDADFYIINHDGFQVVQNALRERDDIDAVIVDECSVYRNAKTSRYKVFSKFINDRAPTVLWMLSGSPVPNAPTDAWAQVRLVNKDAVPKYFTRFRDMTMRQITQFKWVPKSDAIETVRKVMVPAIRYRRDDCIDLPPTIYQNRQCELTSQQSTLYKDMQDKLAVQFDSGDITAANEGVKLMKLVQVCCGVIYGADARYRLDASKRISLLKELVEEVATDEKVIVFTHLTEAVHLLREEMTKAGHSVESVYGDTTPTQRNLIFRNFQQSARPRVLVAHPGTMAHGLTLTAASTIVWYSPINSAEIYEQANGRITRSGQTKHTSIVHIMATDLERKMYERLKQKQSMQGLLLDAIQGGL